MRILLFSFVFCAALLTFSSSRSLAECAYTCFASCTGCESNTNNCNESLTAQFVGASMCCEAAKKATDLSECPAGGNSN